jgi:hypothetical protein
MSSTYEKIATTTITNGTSTITFSSIPSTYTDLVLVHIGTAQSGLPTVNLNFNNDTATNYSRTYLLGDGTSAASGRNSTASAFQASGVGEPQTTVIYNIFNYSNSTTYKTVISRTALTTVYAVANVGLWRSTAAINRIDLSGMTWSGGTVTLYGIKAE